MKTLIITLLLPIVSWAESDHQSWNSLKIKSNFANFSYGVELENRTSGKVSSANLNQIKPEVFYKLSAGKIGFIYTFETDDMFNEKAENRYSFAYDFKPYKTDLLEVNTRFRQEFRNFSDQNQLAYRFRFRNSFNVHVIKFWNVLPAISSEWRIYQKDSAGKSFENFSHRTVLAFKKPFQQFELSLHYTHNYQKEDEADQNTHALGFKLGAEI